MTQKMTKSELIFYYSTACWGMSTSTGASVGAGSFGIVVAEMGY